MLEGLFAITAWAKTLLEPTDCKRHAVSVREKQDLLMQVPQRFVTSKCSPISVRLQSIVQSQYALEAVWKVTTGGMNECVDR